MITLPSSLVQCASDAADLSRQILLKYFRTNPTVETKADASPVTIADRVCEQSVKQLIEARLPQHGFIGEESGGSNAAAEWCWVMDPIDGTKCFATGIPTFGFLIALLHHGIPLLGIIDHAALDQRWLGISGQPTTCNGQLCNTATLTRLDQAAIHTTTPDMFNNTAMMNYNLLSKACRFRSFGGDCYLYGLLASGYTALVCEADLKSYDMMALVPVIEGAGGVISDWQNQPLTLTSGDQVLASANRSLHQAAIIKLNS